MRLWPGERTGSCRCRKSDAADLTRSTRTQRYTATSCYSQLHHLSGVFPVKAAWQSNFVSVEAGTSLLPARSFYCGTKAKIDSSAALA